MEAVGPYKWYRPYHMLVFAGELIIEAVGPINNYTTYQMFKICLTRLATVLHIRLVSQALTFSFR
jgi:hypothetical protein